MDTKLSHDNAPTIKSLQKYRAERSTSLSVFYTSTTTGAFALLGVSVVARGCFARHLEPSEPKDIADLLAEGNSQTLRTRREIGTFEIVDPGFGRRPAKQRQQAARE
jgi:hypothetical protein